MAKPRKRRTKAEAVFHKARTEPSATCHDPRQISLFVWLDLHLCRPRPLLGVKRTWRGLVSMSATDPKRTNHSEHPNAEVNALRSLMRSGSSSGPRPLVFGSPT